MRRQLIRKYEDNTRINKELFVDVGGHFDAVTRCDLSEDLIWGLRAIVAPHAFYLNDRHFRRQILTKNPPCWCLHCSYWRTVPVIA